MMAKADEGSSGIMDELFSANDECNDVFIDLESFWRVMGAPTVLAQGSMLEDLPSIDVPQELRNPKEVFSLRLGVLSPSHCRTGCSDGFSESAGTSIIVDGGRLEPSSQLSFAEQSCSRIVADCVPIQGNGLSYAHIVGGSTPSPYCQNESDKTPFETPNHSDPLSSYTANHVIHGGKSSEICHLDHEDDLFGCSGLDAHSENFNCKKSMEKTNLGTCGAAMEDASVIDGDRTSQDASHIEISSCEIDSADIVGLLSGNGGPYLFSSDDPPYVPYSSEFQSIACDGDSVVNIMDEGKNLNEDFISVMPYVDLVGNHFGHHIAECGSGSRVLLNGQVGVSKCNDMHAMGSESKNLSPNNLSNVFSKIEDVIKVKKNMESTTSNEIVCRASEVIDDVNSRKYYGGAGKRPATESIQWSSLDSLSSVSCKTIHTKDEKGDILFEFKRTLLSPGMIMKKFLHLLQDLSQPKSEAILPDGVLAVPLLKHQRIALSWMVNKETKSARCSGGILADDQGLGKTVSMIALILKERSPSSKAPKANKERSGMEMLNLDEDDGASETCHVKEPHEVNGGKTCLQTKGRPGAGTLIVCPTSVLRQWSEELHNKVTSEADLSVLVYHGSKRTKDPLELAKYDVVITTYAIVSMEVPKQPVVFENDDQIGTLFKGFSSWKKRKLLDTLPGKKSTMNKKNKKGIDNELLETISGPLAKVGWFRVVLDEAQSIKNPITQVARACWGLRAKRRWCLSGTPIQNAIDDLYSYFRFLRHKPYANFRTFCERLSAPVHRNPKNGYKKLRSVLKTIMLRRTKGTYIDGEPIINLPPKTIVLKKIDFSTEERDFYCILEADSRAQFAEYAAAGTVKKNYVNILLMLLQLRQACDHPLLVKGFNSSSQMTSSIEMAKKLPREKHIFLLNCLEASLAICGICSDPPEDAVVTVCGHVFCNQCICEHMIGDDTQCPTKNCKTHVTMSHLFSITMLRGAISDRQSLENSPTLNCSDSELAKVSESHSLSCPQGSSKIKAALELLLSLSKPQDPALRTNSMESIEGCYGSELLRGCDSGGKNVTSGMQKDSHNPVKDVGEKAIVFSQWTRMLDFLEPYLKNSSIQYRRLDGTMTVAARDRAVKDFNTLPQVSVMIMSLKAASLGLNMVAACHVILLDPWWNPTTEDQAIDRAHRIGQTRPVSVLRLTVKDTVEDRILALQRCKRQMVASAFGEDGMGSRQARLTLKDLKYLFRVD